MYMTLTISGKFQWKFALWESCQRVLFIVWCVLNCSVLAMFIAKFGSPDNVLRVSHKSRQRSIILIQFYCCQCLLSLSQVALKLHYNILTWLMLIACNCLYYFRRRNLMPHKQSLLKSQHLCRSSKATCSHSSKRNNNAIMKSESFCFINFVCSVDIKGLLPIF